MSSIVLPSTVEELNYLQSAQSLYMKSNHTEKGFDNIQVASYKREVSLPEGVDWDVYDFHSYLNFEEKIGEADDGIVPTWDESLRQRNESFTESFTPCIEDKSSLGVKTFSTVCVDSGSTCIASRHSYTNSSPPGYGGLDEEETYQNLSSYFNQITDFHNTESLSSIPSLTSPDNDASNHFSAISHCSQDSFSEISVGQKRPAGSPDPDASTSSKRSRDSRKSCRKTRSEKQKEMEARVVELEQEREQLGSTIEMLEKAIKAHHVHLCSILGGRQRGSSSLSGTAC